MNTKHKDLTDQIIQAYYKVYNTLGYSFLEKVYENAMSIELCDLGLDVNQQARLGVYYANQLVGEYFTELLEFCDFRVKMRYDGQKPNERVDHASTHY